MLMMLMASFDAGLGQKITDRFREAKLLDDIIDHWDAGKPQLRPVLTCNLSKLVTYPNL